MTNLSHGDDSRRYASIDVITSNEARQCDQLLDFRDVDVQAAPRVRIRGSDSFHLLDYGDEFRPIRGRLSSAPHLLAEQILRSRGDKL
ncbi:hypothetical protein ANCCEY_12346 [Ancylostoma ceylanicum]|uniref:Uncharacterized protein n=1 Tax=Ancylostoma ceylanicum TaxID=53326 RepID=A0A0D6LBE6_9BILA|nr:hypothetical protein ANCCEY_12346 [Ancylostoma ceylanicum]